MPVSRAKSLMTGDAAQFHAEINAGRNVLPCADAHRHEADVVRVGQCADRSAAVEGDVELPRQAVHLAMMANVVVHFAAQRAGVDELLRIDAGGRRAGDVADVVGPGAASDDAEVFQRRDDIERMSGRDLADLQIGARRDVGMAGAAALGNVGDAAKLMRVAQSAGKSQAGT